MNQARTSELFWWQAQELTVGAGIRWLVGPQELSAMRGTLELQLTTHSREDSEEDLDRARIEPIDSLPERFDVHERYAINSSGNSIRCQPLLADRAVVARPRIPLFVPAGEEIRIFVSSPVWLRVLFGDRQHILRELPTKRLSDTWFGSSTLDGELAYSLRTQARTQLSELPRWPYRAITQVVVLNRAADTLSLDRLNLPVPYLSLYADDDGQFWTENVVMRRTASDELATLEVSPKPPTEAGRVHRIAGPRTTAGTNVLVRAFSSLLHNLGVNRTDDGASDD